MVLCLEVNMDSLCVMEDLNGWIGDRVRRIIIVRLEFQVKIRMERGGKRLCRKGVVNR